MICGKELTEGLFLCKECREKANKESEEKIMKIGEEVYIHGFIDEIRKDTIIIRNGGGYFGTIPEETRENPEDRWTKLFRFLNDCRLAYSVDITTPKKRQTRPAGYNRNAGFRNGDDGTPGEGKMTEYQREYYKKNRERILARQKTYNVEHKEAKADYDRERYKKNWKKKAEYNWDYYRRKKNERN